MKIGFIKLYRESEDNFLYFSEAFTKWQAWQDLLLLANYQAGSFNVRGNVVKLEPGQLGYSILTLSKRWKWSRGKVERFLKLLKNERQIEQQTNSVTTLITIVNWQKYQCEACESETQRAPNRATDGQQTDINNNIKNIKNNTKSNNLYGELASPTSPGVPSFRKRCEKFISRFNSIRIVNGKPSRFQVTAAVEVSLKARLEKYKPDEILQALTNAMKDPYHIETNFKYITPEFILREQKIEKFLNQIEPAPKKSHYELPIPMN